MVVEQREESMAVRQTCLECRRDFDAVDMTHFGDDWVCEQCKPVYVQKLREGCLPDHGGDRQGLFRRRALCPLCAWHVPRRDFFRNARLRPIECPICGSRIRQIPLRCSLLNLGYGLVAVPFAVVGMWMFASPFLASVSWLRGLGALVAFLLALTVPPVMAFCFFPYAAIYELMRADPADGESTDGPGKPQP